MRNTCLAPRRKLSLSENCVPPSNRPLTWIKDGTRLRVPRTNSGVISTCCVPVAYRLAYQPFRPLNCKNVGYLENWYADTQKRRSTRGEEPAYLLVTEAAG